ncbi:MAG: DMT family transporter [Acidimicrobiales bacterium]|nr:DMT family transporter [Acidimicrobiales bacterium]RZV48778.1 MAG: DMT family transporter [Acidimicrobiales bacterium]
MAIVLSLIVAAAFGTGDFFGGLSAKRLHITQVVGGSHLIGLIGVFLASVLIDNTFTLADFTIGMAAGAFGALGVGLLYHGLARGPMSIVAPITAVTSAAVPATWGVVSGDRFGLLGWIGVAIAFVAIWLTAVAKDDSGAEVNVQVVVEALLAGVGFGVFFILLDFTDGDSAPWPIVGARLLSATLIVGWLLANRRQLVPTDQTSRSLVVLTGIFDTGSNVLFLYALRVGDLTTVSVLTALYPISTIVLARLVLHERMSRPQLFGAGLAMMATAFIAIG